tara:strand:+ start:2776 stop:3609 length:834 start_codon:yes stop_codon:yes gene_type:complete
MIRQNPFSLYDFLGYFIPGALLFYLILFIDYVENLSENFELKNFIALNSDFHLDKVLFFVILSYSLGHLLNFISSITIERYANWKYNYPSKYLLGFNYSGFWDYKSKRGIVWRISLILIMFPVTVLDLVLGELLGFKNFYTRKLDKFLIDLITLKGQKLFNRLADGQLNGYDKIKVRDYDFHRIITHYTFEHSKNHQFKMVNYVVLYGFLRTLTLITTILIWYILCTQFSELGNLTIITILFLLSLIAYVFFMAFMKFYRRYTLEGLMLIAINEDLK